MFISYIFINGNRLFRLLHGQVTTIISCSTACKLYIRTTNGSIIAFAPTPGNLPPSIDHRSGGYSGAVEFFGSIYSGTHDYGRYMQIFMFREQFRLINDFGI